MTDSLLLPVEQAELLRRLASSPLFRLASRYELGRLLRIAEKVIVPDGEQEPICQIGARAERVFMLLEGDFLIEGKARVDLGRAGGMLIGLGSAILDDGKYDVTVTPTARSTYLAIDAKQVADLYWRSPPLRHAVEMLDMHAGAEASRGAAVVSFSSQFPDTPMSFLIMLLAKEITSTFPDSVLVVRPKGSGAPSVPALVSASQPGALYWVAGDTDSLDRHLPRFDYIFLDGDVDERGAHHIGVELVHAARHAAEPAPHFPRRLQTVVVQPAPLPCARDLTLIDANRQDLVNADACRVHMSLETLRRLAPSFGPDAHLSSLDAGLRRSLGVWARALTLRRTGIALSGGGVYAMQGVYVIQRLLERGVPVDVITATSGGSLVGGYYAALGLAGLDKLVQQGDSGALDAMVVGGMLCGRAMEAFLNRTLGDPCIEHLTTAEFYPGTSGLVSGKGLIATAGPLSLGLRAASSTPPLFASTITAGERLSDGAFTNNLPVQALEYFNTAVTFGLNAYPPSRMPIPECMPQCVTQTLSTVSLVNRFVTFTTAFNLLASVSGRIEGDFATVAHNASSNFPLPWLVLPNFFLASQMVQWASEDKVLNAQLARFEAEWLTLKGRGMKRVRPAAAAR